MRALISILLSALIGFPAGSATYYVDYAAGSNSNAGTSEGAAWKHAPGDPRRSGSVPTSLSAGDRVLFKRGVDYVLTNSYVTIVSSGTAESPIVYSAYGAGDRPRITRDTTLPPQDLDGFKAVSSRGGITISNLAFVDIGGYPITDPIWSTDTAGCTTNLLTDPYGGAGIRMDAGFWDVIIDDCLFDSIGTWTNGSPLSGTQSVSGGGVVLEGGTNAVIRNCEFTKMRNPIRLQANSSFPLRNIDILNNYIHDWIVWGIDVSVTTVGTRVDDLRIIGNRLANKYQHDQTSWTGCNDAPHTDMIFLRNSGTAASWDGTVIAANYFWSDYPDSSGGTAMLYMSEGGGGNALVANNVVYSADDSAIVQVAPSSRQAGGRTVYFFHNTFDGGQDRPLRVTGTNHTLVIHGNIFKRAVDSSTTTLANFETLPLSLQSSSNIWWNALRPSGTYYPFYDTGYRTLATWQGYGYETNSIYADPLFVDDDNAIYGSRDMRLTASSPARGMAADYATLYPQFAVYLTNDIAGNPRVAPFDVGAYEYVDSVGGPTRLKSIHTGNATVGSVTISP